MAIVAKLLAWYMRIMIVVISFTYLIAGDFTAFFMCILGFLVSLLPLMINAMYNVRLHWIFELTFSLVLFWHIVGFFGAYDSFPLWDDVGHIFGGAVLSLIGFAWLYSMNVSKRIKLTLPMIGFISVTWSATAGVVWEIVEFLWDSAQGLVNVYGVMQNGLIDTMSDLTFDLIAAICMVLICMYLVQNAKEKTTNYIINPFVKIIEKRKL